MYEWIFAEGAGKVIVPVVFEDVQLSDIHPRLPDLNVRYFADSDVQPWDKLTSDVQRAYSLHGSPMIEIPLDASQFIRNMVSSLDQDQKACEGAVASLRTSSDKDAAGTLKQIAKKHHISEIRYWAAIAIVHSTSGGDILWDIIEEASLTGSGEVRDDAWDVAGRMGGAEGVSILSRVLRDVPYLSSEAYEKIIVRLAFTNHPAAIPVLAECFTNPIVHKLRFF